MFERPRKTAHVTRAMSPWPLLLLLGPVSGQDALYHIDAIQVVCSSAGQTTVSITSPQAANRATTHVPVFYRTSGQPVEVEFALIPEYGASIMNETVALEDLSSRRLAGLLDGFGALAGDAGRAKVWSSTVGRAEGPKVEAEDVAPQFSQQAFSEGDLLAGKALDVSGQNCEEFFLLDGRSPVEIPDTWSEAREAFRGICEADGAQQTECAEAEEQAFDGYSGSVEPFAADNRLCARLMAYFAVRNPFPMTKARRLKGGGSYRSASGGTASSAYSSRSAGTVGTYGYTSTRLSSSFPAGYRSTGYGFAGRGGALPSRTVGRTAVVVGATVGVYSAWRLRGAVSWHNGNTYNSAEGCDDPEQCEWAFADNEVVYRDDLMNLGFQPSSYSYPLRLRITRIDGEDFNSSRICPPTLSWTPADNDTHPWNPPGNQDLFFALAPVENLEWEEESDDGGAIWIAGIVGVLLFACCVYKFVCSGSAVHRRKVKAVRKRRNLLEGDNSQGAVPQSWNLVGTYTSEFAVEDTCVKYYLSVLPDGTIAGQAGSDGVVNGKVKWVDDGVNPGQGIVMWNQEGEGFNDEVEGSIGISPTGCLRFNGFALGFGRGGSGSRRSGALVLETAVARITASGRVSLARPSSLHSGPPPVVMGTAVDPRLSQAVDKGLINRYSH